MDLTRFAVGDTWSQTDTLASYPASDGWILTTRIVFDGAGTAITLTSAADGDDHVTTETAANTAIWDSGAATWVQFVELAGVRNNIGSGKITIDPDPSTAANGLDLRTPAQIGLDAVRAVLRGTASAGVLSYSIAGRSLQRYSIAELLLLEQRLIGDVKRENGGPFKVYGRLARA
jgi:hypothetical protein